ncbi:Calcium uniporter protein [Abeliophyllum distichum]|uniref:Calcium uniporter protein n=1 Tax=Abeliophyllum distichum TaxID=126358 RepID=A0ABD1Q9M8_9LAMI
MALRKALAKRLFTTTNSAVRHSLVLTVLSKNSFLPNAAKAEFYRQFFTSSGFLQSRAINNHSSPTFFQSFLTLPVGDKLRETIKSLNIGGNHCPTPGADPGFRFSGGDKDLRKK